MQAANRPQENQNRDKMNTDLSPAALREKWAAIPGVQFPDDVTEAHIPRFESVPTGFVSTKDAAILMGCSLRQAQKVLLPNCFSCCIVAGNRYWSRAEIQAFHFPELPQTPPDGYCTAEEAVKICGCCYKMLRYLVRRKRISTVLGEGKWKIPCSFYCIDDLERYSNGKKR